ncbi:MAG TPA: anthranilate synthase component I family protein [Verrucomicrobiota bacterium]|nr:aminodeoxychorismate synthase, component I [Verrucomicrobiales bacterium]HRI14349.1 anthranilate synthase component I family protein [Verrucomicrobiota bacterium]
MRVAVAESFTRHTPDSLASALRDEPGSVLLRTGTFDVPSARYSLVAARPTLTFRSWGTTCETCYADGRVEHQFGNPWRHLGPLLARFELLDEPDLPFPLGGCFGYWGFDLKQFVEPRLTRRAINDLELPDCHLGFFASLVVFDHELRKTWIVATGLDEQGNRNVGELKRQLEWWRGRLAIPPDTEVYSTNPNVASSAEPEVATSMSRPEFLRAVEQAQRYIRAGDIYQVNLAHRLRADCGGSGWDFFLRLTTQSPAPFSAYFDCRDFQLVSSSPELFLRLSGRHIVTRPIKGTRPRDRDPVRDIQLGWELQRSEKENAELVMITDLLRNDLGRICDYGTVRVPDLMHLERFAQVQHLVSTIEGRLRAEVTHLDALSACFPGGSISGAPKIRALEIIDELEPVARGPYCGCHGYLGFNRESQLSVTIRTAVVKDRKVWFHVGSGIVADSIPDAEYQETLAKAGGFLASLHPACTTTPAVRDGSSCRRESSNLAGKTPME